MGVPKFYRFLSERFPLINQLIKDASLLPEVDNLYLDSNGIIHNATHGDGASRVQSMADIMASIMAAIDYQVKLVRPRKLLYVAIDGVAPRAKMNQQRSRRFKAARDLEESRAQAIARGEDLPKDEVFDSNCITPGTQFMAEISENLKFLLRKRVKEDPSWQGLKVILSGHERPGEGEHKIVEFIRAMKLSSSARANGFVGPETRHCMAGLDADLIMLALATHEPHFTLLREKVDFMAFKKQGAVGQTKTATRLTGGKEFQLLHIGLLREYLEADMKPPSFYSPSASAHLNAAPSGVINADALVQASKDAHDELHASVSSAEGAPFTAKDYDGERAIDDFILLTALCGNDFLPHLPSLDIGEGALDTLLALYRTHLVSWGGYLTDSGLIHWERFQKLLKVIGKMESSVFQARADEAAKFAAKQKRAQRKLGGDSVGGLAAGALLGVGEEDDSDAEGEEQGDDDKNLMNLDDSLIPASAKAAAEEEVLRRTAERLKKETMAVIREELYPPGTAVPMADSPASGAGVNEDEKVVILPVGPDGGEIEVKEAPRPPSPYLVQAAAEAKAKAAAGAAGAPADLALTFKTRYYLEKLGITYKQGSSEDDRILGRLVHSYAEALQWVLLYYYRGVPSWGWFFPFHYAPMTSDLADEVVKRDDKTDKTTPVQIAFRLGQPFKPFQQLLGCLPAASAKFLPQCYRELMTSPDSPLIHFYPDVSTIRLDQNGKRNPWEAVTLIPFIQEAVMLDAIAKYCDDSKLTEEERRRNSFGSDWLIEADPTNTETLPSPLPITKEQPNGYTDLMACGTKMMPFRVETPAVLAMSPTAAASAPSSNTGGLIAVTKEAMSETAHLYRARPHPEAIVPAVGYPTLHTVRFSPFLQAVRLNVFGMPSRKDSMLVAVGKYGRRRSNMPGHDAEDDGDEEGSENPQALQACHLPVFSTPYADGTTVAAVQKRLTGSAVSSLNPAELEAALVSNDLASFLAERQLEDDEKEARLAREKADAVETEEAAEESGAKGHHGSRRRHHHGSSGGSAETSALKAARHLLGRVVYCDWPHLQQCVITGVSDVARTVRWHGSADDRDLLAHNAGSSNQYHVDFGTLLSSDDEDKGRDDSAVANSGDVEVHFHSVEDSVKWQRDLMVLTDGLKSGKGDLAVCGVDVGSSKSPNRILIHCTKLVGMQRDPNDGSLYRVWGNAVDSAKSLSLPELTLLSHPRPDSRLVPHGPTSLKERFPVGTAAVLLRGSARGLVGKVVAHGSSSASGAGADPDDQDLVKVSVALPPDAPEPSPAATGAEPGFVLPQEPPFGHSIGDAIKDSYFDSKKAADSLGIAPGILGKITGSVIFNPGRFDLGLNLKVASKGLFLPAYVRSASGASSSSGGPAWAGNSTGGAHMAPASTHSGGGWEYTERALHLVAAYQRAFPQIFALLESAPNEPFYSVQSLPGKGKFVERVGTWLQQLDTYKKPLAPTSSSFMAPAAITAVQKAADAFTAAREKKTATLTQPYSVTLSVRPADLFAREKNAYSVGGVGSGLGLSLAASSSAASSAGSSAAVAANVDGPSMVPRLGDRVCNLSYSNAPLGARGTVVAIHAASGYVEVVFDVAFLGGTILSGLCGKDRGALLPWSALLCLSRLPGTIAVPADGAKNGATAGSQREDAALARAGGMADDGMPRGKKRLVPSSATAAAALDTGKAADGKAQEPQQNELEMIGIAQQVDFYVSDANLSKDKFLKDAMAKERAEQEPEGSLSRVSLSVLLTFSRMRHLLAGESPAQATRLVVEAVRKHSKAGVAVVEKPKSAPSASGKKDNRPTEYWVVRSKPFVVAPAAPSGTSTAPPIRAAGGSPRGKKAAEPSAASPAKAAEPVSLLHLLPGGTRDSSATASAATTAGVPAPVSVAVPAMVVPASVVVPIVPLPVAVPAPLPLPDPASYWKTLVSQAPTVPPAPTPAPASSPAPVPATVEAAAQSDAVAAPPAPSSAFGALLSTLKQKQQQQQQQQQQAESPQAAALPVSGPLPVGPVGLGGIVAGPIPMSPAALALFYAAQAKAQEAHALSLMAEAAWLSGKGEKAAAEPSESTKERSASPQKAGKSVTVVAGEILARSAGDKTATGKPLSEIPALPEIKPAGDAASSLPAKAAWGDNKKASQERGREEVKVTTILKRKASGNKDGSNSKSQERKRSAGKGSAAAGAPSAAAAPATAAAAKPLVPAQILPKKAAAPSSAASEST